jgi:hypothetical protein
MPPSRGKITLALYPLRDYLMDVFTLWDFLSSRGENVMLRWVKDARLTPRDRAVLNQKLDRLRQMDFDLAIGTKLLAGPIEKQRHIYKLVIHGDVMLRPLLCRGPIDPETEYTMLLGAIERGGRLPRDAPQQAEDNRLTVVDDPSRRDPHERIPRHS